MSTEFTELLIMNKSRRKPKVGDVFVIQPKDNIYFFGKVIETNIESVNQSFQGMYLIYLYNKESSTKEIPDELDSYPLLFAPTVINRQGWLKGYFETIGNQAVTKKELSVDYGFFRNHDRQDEFYDLKGEIMNHKPQYSRLRGLASYGYVGRAVHCKIYGK